MLCDLVTLKVKYKNLLYTNVKSYQSMSSIPSKSGCLRKLPKLFMMMLRLG